MTASYASTEIVADVGDDSLWRQRESVETAETLKLEGAHIFQDRWQAGISVPVVRRVRNAASSTGFGDLAGTLGYEYLPEWDYSVWRPRGFGFLQLTAPTGRSVDESDATYQLDARGRGFWAVGLGTVITKIIGKWDVYADFDLHRSLPKNFNNSQAQGTLTPGYGGNVSGGAGYNFAVIRFGGAITWSYEDPVNVTGTVQSSGAPQRFATAVISGSYLFKNDLALSLNYADQTLFGSPSNTSLGRGVTLLFQKHWPR